MNTMFDELRQIIRHQTSFQKHTTSIMNHNTQTVNLCDHYFETCIVCYSKDKTLFLTNRKSKGRPDSYGS